ncbi:serine--tRNA ligase [Trifolium repens]|nr:serine--tRNA ligase [Trifolium repens]
MDLPCYLNKTTFKTFKLASTSSSSIFVLPSLHKTKTLTIHSHKFPFPQLTKPLSTSSAAVQTSPATTNILEDQGGKPQWKASIDFKWIKDNKETVAANIKKLYHLIDFVTR